MYKPRVVIAFVEAGMGHIAPATSIADAFEKKYGDYTQVVRSRFFSESGDSSLKKFEQLLCKNVRMYNKAPLYGYACLSLMNIFGPRLTSEFIMSLLPHCSRDAVSHLEELNADMLLSTHWSTAYYATKCDKKPINVSYVPDVHVIPLCRYPNDLTLVSTAPGYARAIKRYPKRFDQSNLRLVPFAIRSEAFSVTASKQTARMQMGLDKDKFTVILLDGGYGIGKTGAITKILAERDMSMTLIPVCGKNQALLSQLKKIKPHPSIDYRPMGFTDKIPELLACADLFLGKGGASSVAEPCFFGVPTIVTGFATQMEQSNADYYVNTVKNAICELNPRVAAKKVEYFYNNRHILKQMSDNALAYRHCYGSEKIADAMWDKLTDRFPHLQAINIK